MSKNPGRPPRVAFFGAAPDTPNMGVSALFYSTLYLLSQRVPGLEFVVFDNGLGERERVVDIPERGPVKITLFGARVGRKYHRPENLATMCFAARFGALGKAFNRAIQLIDSCDAVIDISGGDSFSDIYGTKRFLSVLRPKVLAHRLKKPLILLPQTYGPYKDPAAKELASDVVQACEAAWARDEFSYQKLCGLVEGRSAGDNLHCGVDMAFGLPAVDASDKLSAEASGFMQRQNPSAALVGFNVSGLIYNDTANASRHYGFQCDYQSLVLESLRQLLSSSPDVRVCLIPHVLSPVGHYESDIAAAVDVERRLSQDFPSRVMSVHGDFDQCHLKWIISKMDWFCGTRMHSTIAALSSGVPAASIVYSDKARGVFRSCGQEQCISDPRSSTAEDIVQRLITSFDARDTLRTQLAIELDSVQQRLDEQLDAICGALERAAAKANDS